MNKVVGIGVDMVAIGRVARVLGRNFNAFARRTYAPSELERYGELKKREGEPGVEARGEGRGWLRSEEFLASRWAAKEATLKALGSRVPVDGIAVVTEHRSESTDTGKPVLRFEGVAARAMKEAGVTSAHLSLSHEEDYTVAMVVLEGPGRG